jgi:hypothetical protein
MGDPIGKALGEAAGLIDSYKKQAEHAPAARPERREHGDLQDAIKSYCSLLLFAPATACRSRGYLFNLLVPSVAVLS